MWAYKNFQFIKDYRISFKVSIIVFVIILSSIKVFPQELSPEQIFEKLNDAVVVVEAIDFQGNLIKQGSGVVLNEDGFIVTNYHIYDGCERLQIKHLNTVLTEYSIIGFDVDKDILAIKLNQKHPFNSIICGNSEKLKVGQRIYTIGSPLGLENSMSEGIISGLRNTNIRYKNFIQITASISPGSSGGAVVNVEGDLIGVSTSSFSEGQNLNFAIPINEVLELQVNTSKGKSNELFSQGFNALGSQEFEIAITLFTQYLRDNPNDPTAFYNRALAYSELGKYNYSIPDNKKAIKLDPSGECGTNLKGSAQLNLGVDYLDLQDYDMAIKYFNEVLILNPKSADAYYNLGLSYEGKRDYKTGWVNFEKAIEIEPDGYPEIYYSLGKKAYSDHDNKLAISYFTKALSIDPELFNIYFDRAMAFFAINDLSKACKDWKIAYNNGKTVAMKFIEMYCK